MKLALIISSLQGGGAERVMATLANAWVRRGVAVTLITINDARSDVYSLDQTVERIGLGLQRNASHWWQGLANNFRRVHTLRAALRVVNPDVILSFITSTNVLTVFAARPLRTKVVVTERSSPQHHYRSIAWGALRRYSYKRASTVVVQTQRGADWLRERISGVPVRVVPNPAHVRDEEALDSTAQAIVAACRGRKILLAVGRLDPLKGYDRLLGAFTCVVHSRPDWRLVILGEGPARSSIEGQIHEFGLEDCVLLPGFSNTPHALMRRAQVFALSSRYEGFPNVLLEAMACGLPCVSFDCPTGPRELIEHESNGLLVPEGDVAALSEAMVRLMDEPVLRERLGHVAQTVVGGYSLDSILSRWDELFEAC